MSRIHIAMITPWNKRGGIADYSETLYEHLQDDDDVKVTPIKLDSESTANPWRFVRVLSKVPSSADIIHTQFEAGVFGKFGITGTAAPLYFSRLAENSRPAVTTLHEVHRSHSHMPLPADLLLRGRDTIIERLALRASTRILVPTNYAARVLDERHNKTKNVDTLPHPVQTDAEPIDTAVAKRQLGYEKPLLLTFGWIESKKKYRDVFEAMQSLPEVEYLIAGEPRTEAGETYLKKIKQLAAEYDIDDRVNFYGYVPKEDISTVFSAADITVLPYDRVSQSGVVNQALAHERPVITTTLPAFTELKEEYSCLTTYTDSTDLTERIETILSDASERNRLRTAAREYVQTETWERFADRTVEIYNKIVD